MPTSILVDNLEHLDLGRQGESGVTSFSIDCSAWLADLPGCQLVVACMRAHERSIYLPAVTVSGVGVISWTVSADDTARAGYGYGEVRALLDGVIKKSQLFRTFVEQSLDDDGSIAPPAPPDWVADVQNKAVQVNGKAEEAASSATAAASSATAAAGSATAAAGSATAAAGSATAAAGSATAAAGSATAAAGSATEAAQSASEAAEAITSVIDSTLTQSGKAADAKTTGDRIGEIEDIVLHPDKNYAFVKAMVKIGMGPTLYPVGTQFVARHEIYGDLVFDVVGHDHHVKADDADAHTMTLLMHNTVSAKPYDAPEALYYVSADVWPSGMPAGNYYFEIPDAYSASFPDWTGLGFTTTEAIPVGGQICISWTSGNASSIRISTYSSAASMNRIEPQITPTSSTAGTNLGVLGLKGNEFDGKNNYLYAARRGLTNWAQSNLRQWANSIDAIFNWIPQNVFDRLGTAYADTAGFAHGFSADFLAALVNVKISTFTNVIFGTIPAGGAKLEETEDKFFLPSYTEVFGAPQNGISDGAGLEYYDGAAAAQRVKYLYNSTTTATKYELRSGVYNYVNNIMNVSIAGVKDSNYAMDQTNIAFTCVIG